MSTDGIAEQEATLARAKGFCGGRAYDYVPDDLKLERYDDPLRTIKPYIIVTFAPLFAQNIDDTLSGVEDQPQIMGTLIECWAASGKVARQTAGAIRASVALGGFLGWAPSAANATAYVFGRGAGSFAQKDASGRPSRFMESVALNTTLNMSS